jgi:hypothetical protein
MLENVQNSLWVVKSKEGTVLVLDPESRTMVAAIPITATMVCSKNSWNSKDGKRVINQARPLPIPLIIILEKIRNHYMIVKVIILLMEMEDITKIMIRLVCHLHMEVVHIKTTIVYKSMELKIKSFNNKIEHQKMIVYTKINLISLVIVMLSTRNIRNTLLCSKL